MFAITSNNEGETRAIAARLASLVRPGDVIVLAGPLGSGKTAFAGGLAAGLGVQRRVTSPSFVLMRSYDDGFVPFIHVDVYRLSTLGEFSDLDVFEEGRKGVVAIEWGDAVGAVLPLDHLSVNFDVLGDEARLLRFEPAGAWSDRPLGELVV